MDHLTPDGVELTSGLTARVAGEPDFYQVLDVEPGASRVAIRESYLRLKSTYGAGSAALYSLIGEDEAKEQLARVEEAFRVLGDEAARRDYDTRFGFSGRQGRAFGATSEFERHVNDETVANTERLMLMRDHAAPAPMAQVPELAVPAADPNVVRTTRSTLPIIKLKANKVGTEDVALKYKDLIAAADPGDGDLFKRLREAAGVAEHEMQERIKVSIGYLRAIEGNRFERLPQAVYVKGFLRSYFRYLAVPEPEKLVAAFSARLMDWQTNKKS